MDAASFRPIRLLCLLGLVCLTGAPAWAVNDISGLGNLDLGIWTPATGTASTFDDFCVASRLGNSQNPGRYAARVTPYAGTRFELLGLTSPGSTIPITLTFQDLTDGITEALIPATFTLREQNGLRTCNGTNNARIIATAVAANVAAAPPGQYQSQFQLTGRGIPSNSTLSRDFSIRLRVSEMIRISGLDAIDLGTFDGIADRQGTDDFCVYSNGLTGRYTVTATGQGTAGAFRLTSGNAVLPFALEYDDGSGPALLAPTIATPKLNAVSTSIDCLGGSNARIRATVRSADLQNADSGTYAGEVTLLVAPI